MNLSGKTILVTGGASGIGAATAKKAAARGAEVLIADKDLARGQQVVDVICDAGGRATLEAVDLTDEDSIAAMGRRVVERWGALHGLVNNAGILRFTPLDTFKAADWDQLMTTNLKSAALVTVNLLPALKQAGAAAIVNISSDGGFVARATLLAYDISKGGMCVMTRSMAAELVKHGIRVNTVAPGFIVTEMHYAAAADPAARKRELEEINNVGLMGRLGRPEEIASAICFLLSDDASYITATTLHVDGGITAL
jgi:NAD(P)-dependent dehydrogenase (short-subunit alcohol dehydrogenase family)